MWILTYAEKQKKGKIEAPQCSQQTAVTRLHTIDKLHYTLQEFADLHPAHQTNIIKARQRDYHGNSDEAVLIPGDQTREYSDGMTAERLVEKHCEDEYYLKGLGPLDGVLRRPDETVLQTVVREDGLTNQERGMVDRILYPKTGKGKRYVRKVRRHCGRTHCDMITDDAKTETQALAQVLHTLTTAMNHR